MANRLVHSSSLYLRKHTENPVDWWPWCDEALAQANADNKPIFLSIGYSSCHWCTVMEGEAFSDESIAAYLNQNFLPIKVDREERPDIDSIYMQALQMIMGQGGWPLNIFLTPDWLESAIALQAQFDQTLGSDQGGYINAASEQLIVQERAYQDSAVPAANGVAIASLVRLFLLTENLDHFTQAETALNSFSQVLEKAPRACPSLLSALDWFMHPTLIRIIKDTLDELAQMRLPTAVIRLEETLPDNSVALVCKGLSCQKPATSVEMMRSQIKQSQELG
ncbi:MAG: DUF255 domain-containing protein [Cyanobacteria bacterium J06621_11]